MSTVLELGLAAKAASRVLATAGTSAKNQALDNIADALLSRQEDILAANAQDLDNARTNGLPTHLIDRLALTEARLLSMAEGVRQVAALPDPIGTVEEMTTRPNGLMIGRQRVPIGLIGLIFEARPNVSVDAAVLCLKAGNATLLRGGKEAICSNMALVGVMRDALTGAGLPADCIVLVEDTDRQSARDMMGLTGVLDVLIPRGGAGLIRSVVETARVPVIETGVGNCHVYVDADTDLAMARDITVNAKCSRPSVCNACETLLVARPVAGVFLPMVRDALSAKKVELRGCQETMAILGDGINPVTPEDYATEFNDYILAVRVVSGVDEAMAHIAQYSSGHSEAIVTTRHDTAMRFLSHVDSAAVYVNASTRYTDGFEFGLGAEIGISTQKIHARGPMGLLDLTSHKFIVFGQGQIRT